MKPFETRGELVNQLRQRRAARALQNHEVEIPHRCCHCQSSMLTRRSFGYLSCVQCGHESSIQAVNDQRCKEMKAFITKGRDLLQ